MGVQMVSRGTDLLRRRPRAFSRWCPGSVARRPQALKTQESWSAVSGLAASPCPARPAEILCDDRRATPFSLTWRGAHNRMVEGIIIRLRTVYRQVFWNKFRRPAFYAWT